MKFKALLFEGQDDYHPTVTGDFKFAKGRIHEYKADAPLTKVINPETDQVY